VGIGPRYCPSIETKIVRFADRDAHQVFLEPESLSNNVVYVNGASTSLPADVQDAFLRSIEGLENARVERYGYAIEYTAFPPTQLRPTLETLAVPGLYLAGQIVGTSGYEEAAGLGLVAGANAALRLRGDEPLALRRDEAYIGVMIDDLITKGTPEPYRLFTSRAEYRLLLRQDNADLRLTPKGRKARLVDDRRWECFERFRDGVERECARLRSVRVRPSDLDPAAMAAAGETMPNEPLTLERLLTRPGVTYRNLRDWGFGPRERPERGEKQEARSKRQEARGKKQEARGKRQEGGGRSRAVTGDPRPQWPLAFEGSLADRIADQAEIRTKYAGYIARQIQQVGRTLALETRSLPTELDYPSVPSLRREAALALVERRPATVGQASRIPGVNPADITALLIYLTRMSREQEAR